jgi:hypothetical protein
MVLHCPHLTSTYAQESDSGNSEDLKDDRDLYGFYYRCGAVLKCVGAGLSCLYGLSFTPGNS